jgi:hypothetical protein
LGQEVRTFEVDGQDTIEPGLICLEEIGPGLRSYSCVVDQNIQTPKLSFRKLDQISPVLRLRDVRLKDLRPNGVAAPMGAQQAFARGSLGRGPIARVIDNYVATARCQFQGDSPADAARRARYECYCVHARQHKGSFDAQKQNFSNL